MAEGGYSAGSIFLQVVPSFRGFETEARRVARDMEDEVERALDEGSDKGAKKAGRNIERVFASDRLTNAARESGHKQGDAAGGAFEQAFKKRVSNALDAIGKSGGPQLAGLRKDLESLRSAKIGVDVSSADAVNKLREIHARATALSALSPQIDVQANTAKAAAELAALEKDVKRLNGQTIHIGVDVDRSGMSVMSTWNRLIGRTGKEADDTANSFRAFNAAVLAAVTLGPSLIPILTGIVGALVLLGPAAIAAVAGLGALAIAFSGVGTAVKALNEVQKNAARDQQANTKRIRNAAEQVEGAERRLQRARADGARSTQDAARRVTRAQRDTAQANQDAARRVEDAQRRQAEAVESAVDRQERAERSLTDAQRDATRAVEDLREARRKAQEDLDDIADRQRQNKVDERQAVLDLFQATVDFRAAQADPGATNLEKEQASINLENARLRLEEIREEQGKLTAERKKGVKGSEGVKSAEDNLANALEAQKTAQEELGEATAAVNQARVDGAREVKDAIADQNRTAVDGAEAVSDALRAQKQAGVDAAQGISDAQTALTQSQADYRDALIESNELGSASAQKLREAMAALSPAGQAFAVFIFGLKDEFIAIRNAVQEGLFPGLTESIKILTERYLPGFTRFMGTIGRTFGNLAVHAAKIFVGDDWSRFFAVFEQVSPVLIENFAKAFLNIATAMANIATLAAPFAVAMSEGFLKLTQEFVKFTQSAEGQKLLISFFESLRDIGPHVTRFLEALVPAFVALVKALMPLGTLILDGLTAILEWIAAMDPKLLQAIVVGILTLVAAFQLAALATTALSFATSAFATPLGTAVGLIVLVVGALIYLYTTNETARKIIDGTLKVLGAVFTWTFEHVIIPLIHYTVFAWKAFADGMQWAWANIIKPVIDAMVAGAQWLWRVFGPTFTLIFELVKSVFKGIWWYWTNILWPVYKAIYKVGWELWQLMFSPVFDAIKLGWAGLATALEWTWNHVLKPLFEHIGWMLGVDSRGATGGGLLGMFNTFIRLVKVVWDGLRNIAKAPIKFIIETVLNNGLLKGFNWLADKLGMDKVDPIPLPKGFARGGVTPYGVRPGYTPGRDTHLIAVGGGEAILRPELTRALGTDWIYAANARARMGGVQGAAAFLQGFASGGVAWPVPGSRLGARFGQRGRMWSSGYHTGQDFVAPTGRGIHSVMAGRVSDVGWSSWGGNLTKIIVPGLGTFYYAHQSGTIVREGQQVGAGQQIGFVGSTGNTTGPHLHLELRIGGRAVDPMPVFDGQTGIIRPEAKGQSRLQRLLGGLSDAAQWVKDAVANPINYLKGKIKGPVDRMFKEFGDNWLTRGLAKIPDKFIGALVDKIKSIASFGNEASPAVAAGQLQRMVHQMAALKYGWDGAQWNALNWIVNKESSWNPNAQNPTSTAYGLFQFLDGTWGAYGPKTSDPRLQAEYGLKYIKDRYGDPERAMLFHQAHGWYSEGGVVPGGIQDNGTMMYDNGGYIPPGLTTVLNLTGKPEPVFTDDQFDRMRGGATGGFHYAPTFVGTDLTAEDVAGDILFAANRMRRGGVYPGGGRPL